jgi:hypothetical protein
VLRVRRTHDTTALWLIALLAPCASVGHWLMSLAKMLAVRCSSRHSQDSGPSTAAGIAGICVVGSQASVSPHQIGPHVRIRGGGPVSLAEPSVLLVDAVHAAVGPRKWRQE